MRSLAVVLGLILSWSARASPNVSPEDVRYDELARRQALEELGLYQGGFGPLSESRIRSLLGAPALPRRGWLRLDRALVRGTFARNHVRSYSTTVRPRDIAGGVSAPCEHEQGRPCAGIGMLGEIDGSAGYGDIVSGTVRLRANVGSNDYAPALAIDRAYVIGEIGPIAAEIGRDILIIGPRSRTQLGWGDHAPPLDHVRFSTARPFQLHESLAANMLYLVGRLRDPQAFPGGLVTIARLQLDIANRVELGTLQLLTLGGEGAPPIGGPLNFIAEHVRRSDSSATGTDSSNRRFGGDVAVRIPGVRLYYAIVFEDIRRSYWHHAIRRDADHLFGADFAALGPGGRHSLVVEVHTTGVRSQEHHPRVTGFTNAGRVGGAPLGPNASSLYVAGRITLAAWTLRSWIELARADSDGYTFTERGPIERAVNGPAESRYRLGSHARVPLAYGITVETEALVEHVSGFGFEPGVSRTNTRVGVGLLWQPSVR